MVCPDMLSACQMRYLSVTTNALKLTSIFAHAAMLIFGGNECNVNQYTSRYWPNSFIWFIGLLQEPRTKWNTDRIFHKFTKFRFCTMWHHSQRHTMLHFYFTFQLTWIMGLLPKICIKTVCLCFLVRIVYKIKSTCSLRRSLRGHGHEWYCPLHVGGHMETCFPTYPNMKHLLTVTVFYCHQTVSQWPRRQHVIEQFHLITNHVW